MMAALSAACVHTRVTLVERNERCGRKIYITGKGRCNLTNDCTADEALGQIPRNGRFLFSAMRAFPPAASMEFFSGLGLSMKVERGNRVFPVSDRASDVIDVLVAALKRAGVHRVHARAQEIVCAEGRVSGVRLEDGTVLSGDRVILATGGVSYPGTGSTGDGYRMAQALGHTVTPPCGSLVPLEEQGTDCVKMQGLSLKNTGLLIRDQNGKKIYTDFGELLFTHFGLSGPVILSASAHLNDWARNSYTAVLDLKPALDAQKLDQRLLRDVAENANRDMGTLMRGLLPRLLAPVVLARADIPGEEKAHDLKKEQRRRLAEIMKGFEIPLKGPRPVEEAIVTRGGISVREVNPSTMESKRVPGLYFAGEILDVDAYTGGFNLQIAWATGRMAGLSAGNAE